jgi:hypothetical protein
MPGNDREHLCNDIKCITQTLTFVAVVGCLSSMDPQQSPALAAPMPVVSYYVKAIQPQQGLGLLCQPLPLASSPISP